MNEICPKEGIFKETVEEGSKRKPKPTAIMKAMQDMEKDNSFGNLIFSLYSNEC